MRAADRSWLEVITGAVLLATLVMTAFVRIQPVSNRIPAALADTAGGFLNTEVGVAASAMAGLRAGDQLEPAVVQRETLQPIFSTMSVTSVVARVSLWAAPISGLPTLIVVVLALAIAPVGILVGGRVARRVPAEAGRRVAVAPSGQIRWRPAKSLDTRECSSSRRGSRTFRGSRATNNDGGIWTF